MSNTLTRTDNLIESLRSMKRSLTEGGSPLDAFRIGAQQSVSNPVLELSIDDLNTKDEKQAWSKLKAALAKNGFKAVKGSEIEGMVSTTGDLAVVSVKGRAPVFRVKSAADWDAGKVKKVQELAKEALGLEKGIMTITAPKSDAEKGKDAEYVSVKAAYVDWYKKYSAHKDAFEALGKQIDKMSDEYMKDELKSGFVAKAEMGDFDGAISNYADQFKAL